MLATSREDSPPSACANTGRSARSKSKNTTAEVIRPPSTIVNATRIA